MQACHPPPALPSAAVPLGGAHRGSTGAHAAAAHKHPAFPTAASHRYDLDAVAAFNAQLNSPAAFAHLTLAQPPRLTHADLSLPLLQLLQRVAHPDFLHITNTQMQKER